MNCKKRYHGLMERVRQSHQEFSDAWNNVRTAELLKRGVNPANDVLDRIEEVWEANGVAYKAAQPQSDRRDEFLSVLLEQLPFEGFLAGNSAAIDSILDFLEIDVMAFHCGYIKQWLYHRLKSSPLNEKQIQRLRQLTLEICKCAGQRQELRQLARLMIKLSDRPLIQNLRDLAGAHENKYTRQKALRVLSVVLNGRPDLA